VCVNLRRSVAAVVIACAVALLAGCGSTEPEPAGLPALTMDPNAVRKELRAQNINTVGFASDEEINAIGQLVCSGAPTSAVVATLGSSSTQITEPEAETVVAEVKRVYCSG
jgi:hypothetical protein